MATRTATKPVATVTLTLAKETAGNFAFRGEATEMVNTIYVRKEAFANGEPPAQVTVTVTPG